MSYTASCAPTLGRPRWATHLKRPAGWVELAEGTTLTVEADLPVRHLTPAP